MAQCSICVPRLYKSIIEEVITGARELFLDEGIDEQVLTELRQTWEQKLAATKATEHNEVNHSQQSQSQQLQTNQLSANHGSNTSQNVHQPPVVPAPVNLVPVQITVPAQQAGGVPKSMTIHVPSSSLANGVAGAQLQAILSSPAAAQTFALDVAQATEIIQRQLNQALQQHGITLPPQLLQFNHAPSTTQVDGAADSPLGGSTSKNTSNPSLNHSETGTKKSDPKLCSVRSKIPSESVKVDVDKDVLDSIILKRLRETQVDGLFGTGDSSDEISDDDDDDDDDDNNDEDDKKDDELENEEEEADGTMDDPLNSEDDVSDDESGDVFETDNVVVCQYDKITRVRNKWKFHLKDGIMNLKGKDYLFQKATGEGEW